VIRRATVDDLVVLWELEKLSSSAGLAHVFPPEIPFPDDDVLARWRLVLDEPGVTVLVDTVPDDDDGAEEPVGYAAYGNGWVRHFGVVPAWWGSGRAHSLHTRVLAGLAAEGARTTYLWVLVENHRARAFYVREGWHDTGVREEEVFAPYPVKMQMRRDGLFAQ
jgi:GNAT superfamily N-acetyltransferase